MRTVAKTIRTLPSGLKVIPEQRKPKAVTPVDKVMAKKFGIGPAVLTNRQRRMARKMVKKSKRTVHGMSLDYKMFASVEAHPTPSDFLKYQWQRLDEKAASLFKGRKYDNLNAKQKLEVVGALKDGKDGNR